MPADGASAPANWQRAGFGIYVHWPFCAAKCPYCDFNSHVAAEIDHARWSQAYQTALDHWADLTAGQEVRSVFFGGGTPSLMEPATVASVLNHIAARWPVSQDVEITLEANPTSVEADKFTAFRDTGVNRVSLGVQALNDNDLKRLGRLHNTAEALAALQVARERFDRVSFDLIYARQDQPLGTWQSELLRALSFEPDHLSLYQLTIEPGTAFHTRFAAGGLKGLPDEDRAADLFDLTQSVCDQAGLPAYEVSNHARPGAESRHNLIYWRGGDWLGIGPGAHGRLEIAGSRVATNAVSAPGKWLTETSAGKTALIDRQPLSSADTAEEYLMMGLRLFEGADLTRLDRATRVTIEEPLVRLQSDGLLWRNGRRIGATARGRILLNAVLVELLSG